MGYRNMRRSVNNFGIQHIGTMLILTQLGLTSPRVFRFPDTSDTVSTLTATQTLTNKTVDYNSNSILNLPRDIDVYDYIVYFDRTNYKAINTLTDVVTSNTSFSSLMSTLNTNLSSGGTIFFRQGTYNVDSPITFSNNINLIGDGRGQTVLLRTTTNASSTITHTGSNVTIARLTVNGNYPTNTSNTHAELQLSGSNMLCTDVEVKAFEIIGINAGIANGLISNCIITGANVSNVSLYGIWCDITSKKTISKCIITNCAFNGIFAGSITTIEDCYFANNSSSSGGQVAVGDSAAMTTVKNCVFDADAGAGDGIEASGQSSSGGEWCIIGNRISNQSGSGIVMNGGALINKATVIQGNIIKNSGAFGVFAEGGNSNFSIIGNIFSDDQTPHTQAYGVGTGTNAASSNYIIKDNIFFNNFRPRP
jgi:Pectate lyase superfamily protein